MFLDKKDLVILETINKDIKDERLSKIIKKYNSKMDEEKTQIDEKIKEMRKQFPLYARSKKVQENHYKRYFRDVIYYIEKKQLDIAKLILSELIKENEWSHKQKEYFISTFPTEVMKLYKDV